MTQIHIMTYNICWECFTGIERSRHCHNYKEICQANIKSIISSKHLDFLGIQEGKVEYNLVDNMELLHYARSFNSNALLYYNNKRFEFVSNTQIHFLCNSNNGRPGVGGLFKDKNTNKYYLVISLHNGHNKIINKFKNPLETAINQNQVIKENTYEMIIMGDFNMNLFKNNNNNNNKITINGKQMTIQNENKETLRTSLSSRDYTQISDNILTSENLNLENDIEYLDAEENSYASDHKALYAVINDNTDNTDNTDNNYNYNYTDESPFINKFITAQNNGITNCSTYDVALQEIQQGKKETHWIWYVIPTPPHINGTSHNNVNYSLKSYEECLWYLDNDTLRQRYLQIITEIYNKILEIKRKNNNNMEKKNKYNIATLILLAVDDFIKLKSSVELFKKICYSIIVGVDFGTVEPVPEPVPETLYKFENSHENGPIQNLYQNIKNNKISEIKEIFKYCLKIEQLISYKPNDKFTFQYNDDTEFKELNDFDLNERNNFKTLIIKDSIIWNYYIGDIYTDWLLFKRYISPKISQEKIRYFKNIFFCCAVLERICEKYEEEEEFHILIPGDDDERHNLGTNRAWSKTPKDEHKIFMVFLSFLINKLKETYGEKIEFVKNLPTIKSDNKLKNNVIMVWGANGENWNIFSRNIISGTGQAASANIQKRGVFGIVTTFSRNNRINYSVSNLLSKLDGYIDEDDLNKLMNEYDISETNKGDLFDMEKQTKIYNYDDNRVNSSFIDTTINNEYLENK